MKTLKIVLISVLFITNAHSATHHVPSIYPTIQSALDICQAGDSVVVQPGTYTESITWPQVSEIKLIGVGGSALTTILAPSNSRVLLINNPLLDTNTVIKGFRLSGGYLVSGHGAGVYLNGSTVLFEDITIAYNHIYNPNGDGYGAGLYMYSSSSVLRNCIIFENMIDSANFGHGGGIYIYGGSPVLKNVIVSNNRIQADTSCRGFGIYATNCDYLFMEEVKVTGNTAVDWAYSYAGNGMFINAIGGTFYNVLVAQNVSGFSGPLFNAGGGIYVESSIGNLNFINCTITQNSKAGGGIITGIGMYNHEAAVILANCIVYNNLGFNYEIMYGTFAYMDVQYCNITSGGYTGQGTANTTLPPQFVSSTDFHLLPSSPNAGTGTNIWYPLIDLDGVSRPLPAGTMPDRGCYEVDQSTIGLNVMDSEGDMNIFPNPAQSILNIKAGCIAGSDCRLIISDVTGKILLLKAITCTRQKIDISSLSQGIYLLQIQRDQRISSRKFVKE